MDAHDYELGYFPSAGFKKFDLFSEVKLFKDVCSASILQKGNSLIRGGFFYLLQIPTLYPLTFMNLCLFI